MGVVVADRAVHLGEQRDRGDLRAGAAEAGDDVADLLAERRRRRRLAVRAREHRQAACSRASAARVAIRPSSAGSTTSRRAASSISAWLVLLMSSLVQAKWMKPAAPASFGSLAKRSPSQYSTALTSWLVRRSIALIASASASENPCARLAQEGERAGVERRQLGEAGLGQGDEPLDLDPDPAAHQAEFG